jgi:hypothetical protein
MSNYATTDGAAVRFDTKDHSIQAMHAFRVFVMDANAGKMGGDFDILDFCLETAFTIGFRAVSSRAQNLDWQLAQILAFFKAQPGMIEFNAPVLVAADGVYWSAEDEKEAASQF